MRTISKLIGVMMLLACTATAQTNTPWTTNGRIGIGNTNTGNATLTVRESTTSQIRLENDALGEEAGIRWRTRNSAGQYIHADLSLHYPTTGPAYIGFKVPHNNDPGVGYRMLITEQGNLGLGTYQPSAKLHVKGNPNVDPNFNNRQILGYFEQSSGTSNSAGIAIKGAKNNSTSTLTYVDFDIYDNNETTTDFTLARVGSGKESGSGLNGQLRFFTNNNGQLDEQLRIKSNGDIGIGTPTPDAKLTVKGDIHAERVTVDLNIPAPDYVFEEDYDLRSLEETATYITKNKHLPEVPSARELEASGIDLVEMNMLLLKKIEELTLHMIKQNNVNQKMKKELESQSLEIKELKSLLK